MMQRSVTVSQGVAKKAKSGQEIHPRKVMPDPAAVPGKPNHKFCTGDKINAEQVTPCQLSFSFAHKNRQLNRTASRALPQSITPLQTVHTGEAV